MGITAADLAEVTRLTRAGRLAEATRAIQRALSGRPPVPASPDASPASQDVIDVPSREIPADPALPSPRSPAPHPGRSAAPASFIHDTFAASHLRYRYRLYVPSRPDASQALPLIVMLHGCKQDSADFALGTAMNALAERHQALVLYPEQLRSGNAMGCWNWFDPAHQQRGSGEPAMIAALAQQVARDHGGDPRRIHVAGLSAGGAMAALLGQLYPDVFAAVGIHSGLPAGAAGDVQSAFAVMRQGAGRGGRGTRGTTGEQAVPTIVFHGTGDKTVAPGNADAIVKAQLAAWDAAGVTLTQAANANADADSDASTAAHAGRGTRKTTRTQWLDAAQRPVLERWTISAGPHAWSGGDAEGSFTDPKGPDASAAMMAFFLRQRLGA